MMSAVRLDGSVDAWYARLSGKRDDLEPGCRRQHQAASAPKLALSLKPKRRNHRHNPMLCITESHTVGRRGGGDYIQQGPHDSRQSRQPSFNTTSFRLLLLLLEPAAVIQHDIMAMHQRMIHTKIRRAFSVGPKLFEH